MDVIRLLRDASALRAALHQYQAAAERHRERETRLLLMGEERAADLHRVAAALALHAWMRETENPTPRGLGEIDEPAEPAEGQS